MYAVGVVSVTDVLKRAPSVCVCSNNYVSEQDLGSLFSKAKICCCKDSLFLVNLKQSRIASGSSPGSANSTPSLHTEPCTYIELC